MNEFTGKAKQLEKVEYRGELRVIGVIVDNMSNKDTLGYVIMTEKTRQIKPYTIQQTIWLASRYRFVNIEVSNNKIINTECAMDNMPKFNSTLKILETDKAIIIGKIFSSDKPVGFRILSPAGKIIDISEAEVLKLHKEGIKFVNAKFVEKGNTKEFISAIKQQFTRIDKVREVLADNSQENEYRHKAKIDYIKAAALKVLCRIDKPGYLYGSATRLKVDRRKGAKFDTEQKKKIIKIIYEEIIPKTPYYSEATKIMDYYKSGKLDNINKGEYYYYKEDAEEVAIYLLMQFLVNKNEIEEIRRRLNSKYRLYVNNSRNYGRKKFVKKVKLILKGIKDSFGYFLDEELIVVTDYKMIVNEFTNKLINLCKETELKLSKSRAMLPGLEGYAIEADLEFRNRDTLKAMRVSIENGDGKQLPTRILHIRNGNNIRYLYNYIPNYSKYMSMAKCLGDLMIIAKTEAILKYYSKCKGLCACDYGWADDGVPLTDIEYKLSKEGKDESYYRSLGLAEMTLAVLAIYRPDIAKEYLDELKQHIPEVVDFLPGVNFEEYTDYGLSEYSSIFYKSGMCAIPLGQSSKIVDIRKYNLRKMDKKFTAEMNKLATFNIIETELSSVVAMITSEYCTDEIINKFLFSNSMF